MGALLLHTAEEAEGRPIGGKAKNLFRLKDLGLNVPPFAVLPADVSMDEHTDRLRTELEQRFANASEQRYAVRSSALDEDGSAHSFAGQFETFLYVPLEAIAEKIGMVRASANSERVRTYRREHGLADELRIGVVVQVMVDADRSGVAFGIDPTTGTPGSSVISALWGLGEGLVSGELDADTWRITAQGNDARIVPKERRVVRDPSGTGTAFEPVPSEAQNTPTLTAEDLAQVGAALHRLEEKLGGPQDIEFAFVGHTFFLLQARPITTVPKGEYTLWDNSNIIESYPGITTPLTFSFILKMYEAVYVQFAELMGVDRATIAKHQHVFANTLGLVRGRVYYNLLHWYKMLAMVPGYSLNARFMENMMGVKERFELREDFRMGKAAAWWRIVKMVFRMVWLQIRLPGERRRFLRHLEDTMQRYQAIPFNTLAADEILGHYRTFETTLLKQWKAPLINDFFAMIWFGVLQKTAAKWVPDAPNLHNDLLCGSRDIISTEPVHACMAIARAISEDAVALAFFLEHGAQDGWKALSQGRFPAIKRSVDDYLHRFGERCVGELKLETISHSQDPARLIAILRTYVEQGITQTRASSTDTDLRTQAEAHVRSTLRGKPLKRWLFNFVLRRARDLVSARENLRFERTRGFGMVRRMFTALGERLAQDHVIEGPRDVFHLELDELLAYPSAIQGWKGRISERKALFASYAAEPPPSERFFTYGNDFTDDAIHSTEKLVPIEGDLKGIGCCPGVVQGRVRKVLDPTTTSSLEGDILVTTSTDPGWVTLFPSASAILVERGSLLSHSAIVSREMGIPCIVSVPGLLRTLSTGDEVLMDGSTGIIRLIAKHG